MIQVFKTGPQKVRELIIRNIAKALSLFTLIFLIPVFLTSVLFAPVFAQETSDSEVKTEGKPRFEFGLASAALQVPAYPSSSVNTERLFVLPWFIYRSDKLQVKDGGVQLIAYQSDRLVIDLGIAGSLNSDTSETPLREGLPDLDFIIELGPRFTVPIFDRTDSKNRRSRLNWVTSFRFAVSTDFSSLDDRGPVLNTQLSYRKDGLFNNKLSFDVAGGPTWLGSQLQDYFFSVDPEFVTPDRPQFDAEAGYLGFNFSAGFRYRPVKRISTFLGLGVNSLAGSRNADSPLFEDELTTQIILGISYQVFRTKRSVQVFDE